MAPSIEGSRGSSPDPRNEDLIDLTDYLRTRVRVIAGSIGERNILKYGALTRARDFIEKELRAAGLAPERQTFHVGPLKVDNVEA